MNDLSGMRKDAVWCSQSCAQRVRRGERAYVAPTSRPSGAQVAYVKAVEAVALDYQRAFGLSAFEATGKAVMVLFPALSAKQQAMLTRREIARLDEN